MPSPRNRFELACRIGAFALLGWLLGTSIMPAPARRVTRASQADVETKLAEWTRLPSSVALHGDFSTTPSARAIDWLSALKRSGHAVTWSGSPPPVALTAEATADPRGSVRVSVAAPSDDRVSLRDDASVIDSVHISNLGGSVTVPLLVGDVRANVLGQVAIASPPDSVPLKTIVVVGGAGWEGRFVVAALEERGWPVVARFAVAPNVDVTQGIGSLVLDTARVAAVVAIDTVVQRFGGAIERFVRSGGGLVLAGPASLAPATTSLAPGVIGTRFRPAVLPRDTLDLGSTGFFPVTSLKPDAVPLERRTGGIAIAARRVGAGRVIQVGYDDSWRWRMAGATGSENAHREWWSRIVSAVAYVPEPVGRVATSSLASAPLALLVDRVGPSRSSAPAGVGREPVDRRLILALIMMLLIAEWASRRLRRLRCASRSSRTRTADVSSPAWDIRSTSAAYG